MEDAAGYGIRAARRSDMSSPVGLFEAHMRELSGTRWQGSAEAILARQPTPVGVPVHHMYGGDDRLIPVKRVRPTRIVPGGGHALAPTHPRELNDFLVRAVLGGAPDTRGGEGVNR